MRYTDSFMDGAGAHPPFFIAYNNIAGYSMYFLYYILCILITSPQFMVNLWLKSIQYHTCIIYC